MRAGWPTSHPHVFTNSNIKTTYTPVQKVSQKGIEFAVDPEHSVIRICRSPQKNENPRVSFYGIQKVAPLLPGFLRQISGPGCQG